MKRASNLSPQFCSFDNLSLAYYKARRGTRRNMETQAFFFHAEKELLLLRDELVAGTWWPQPYRYFDIFDPKHRTISVAAFRDRVVHHALVNVLEPIFERRFIQDSYATRKGKGVHAAVERAQHFLRNNRWFFKSDVEKYFDSIDHDVLLELLARKIKDQALLTVCEKIIRNSTVSRCLSPVGPEEKRTNTGLPIGNLTSQFFANVYLDPFDHFVSEGGAGKLGNPPYLRYMDDFVVFSPDKEALKAWRASIANFLRERLRLSLKPSATYLNSAENGLSFLGRRIFPGTVRLHPLHLRRITGRLAHRERAFLSGELSEECFLQSANSYWAMLAYHGNLPLRRSLLA